MSSTKTIYTANIRHNSAANIAAAVMDLSQGDLSPIFPPSDSLAEGRGVRCNFAVYENPDAHKCARMYVTAPGSRAAYIGLN